jgi:two-component system response regulator ResD
VILRQPVTQAQRHQQDLLTLARQEVLGHQPIVLGRRTTPLCATATDESGSDHHLPDSTGYLLLRAVLASVLRRTVESVTSRHLHVAGMHIDLAARTVEVAETVVCLSPLEFELLVAFAVDPMRVFNKHELARCIWGQEHISGRTVESHVCRLRNRLTDAGASGVLVNRWGHGWSLTTAH